MDERRSTKRQRVLKAGSIQIGAGGAIDCTVRNLSQFGAALDVQSPVGIPDEFILVIPNDRLRLPCRSLAQSRADRDQVRLACIFEMPLGAREAARRTSAFEGNANEISVSPNQPASTCRAKIIERMIEEWRHDIEPAQLYARSVVRDITDTARVNAGVPLKEATAP